MKKLRQIATILFFALPVFMKAEVKEIPFTLDDRDRIIRTEKEVSSLRSEMNARFESVDKRFDAVDKRFDQLFNFLWAIIGIFTTMMVSVLGFAFWDRKLSLAPLKKDNMKLLEVLRDYSDHQPKLREILKNAGLL
ncbi:MAG: hypothetical protein PHP04_13970 [Bacteroidales bacterium]|nr:hypothetical protein [Bacteroidales bacterium]HNW73733.1 hypothetical protein [Bacteroidales bacterium]